MTTKAKTKTKTAPTPAAIDVAKISARAMLVALHITTWTARRYDKKVTAEVNAKHGAAADAGRYNKMLVPSDHPSYKALMQAATDARTYHYTHTLPWADEGWRLITTAEYTRYTDGMRTKRSGFVGNLDGFMLDYPTLCVQAPTRLNGMYDAKDFPPTNEVKAKFSWSIDFAPLPIDGDFRLDLPKATIADLEAHTASRVQSAISAAMADAWMRLRDVVSKAHERLSSPDAIFRDSLVDNIRETCDVLATLNVTGDAALERFRVDAVRKLGTYDAQALRDDVTLRAAVASEADRIMAQMGAFMPTAAKGTV